MRCRIDAYSFLVFVAVLVLPAVCHAAPLTGRWETEDGAFKIVYLPDGRVASLDERSYIRVPIRVEIGLYKVTGDTITYRWLLSGPEAEKFRIDGDTIRVGDDLSSVRRRTGDADEAAKTYGEILKSLQDTAESASHDVPVGPVQSGTLSVNAMIPDPAPTQVFSHATVFGRNTRFQWLLTPVHEYPTLSDDEPGFTCCAYTFLPNGRFCFDGWLYGPLLDKTLPFDDQSPVQVPGRKVSLSHQQHWGKYRVIVGQDVLDGDTVEMTHDDGFRQTMKAIDGRLYLIRENPYFLLNNFELVKKYGQQRLKP